MDYKKSEFCPKCGQCIERKVHNLKILPQYFEEVQKLNKRFELRKDDRDYKVGDLIMLSEWENEELTGRHTSYLEITYILRKCPEYGLMDGYCVLGW